MLQRPFWKFLACTLVAVASIGSGFAQIATEPLLTRTPSVEPNMVINLDDSGSMYYGTLYEYGGSNNYLGNTGPSVSDYAAYSPDVNRIYYDPRILYKRRVNADGSLQAVGATNVYVVDQACNPQLSGSACLNANAPETTSSGTYTIKVFFRNGNGSYTTTSVNPLSAYFNPSYTPSAAELAAGATLLPYPNTNTGGTTTLPKWIARTDCIAVPTTCTWNEEKQNYGNWLAYHSNRMRMSKTGIGLAFQPLQPTFRLGWGLMSDLSANRRLVSGVQLYSSTVRSNFLTWLYAFDNSATPSGTPTLDSVNAVGVYFTRRDNAGPWATNPTSSTAATSTTNRSVTSSAAEDLTHSSCRRSYQLLMTDGYYNSSTVNAVSGSPLPSGAPGNMDGTAQPAISRPTGGTYAYNPIAYPY